MKRIFAFLLALSMVLSLLPMPARAQEPSCGMPEHSHSDQCRLTCGLIPSPDHPEHDPECYDENDEPQCGHHVHNSNCYGADIVCAIAPHAHESGCYTPAEPDCGCPVAEGVKVHDPLCEHFTCECPEVDGEKKHVWGCGRYVAPTCDCKGQCLEGSVNGDCQACRENISLCRGCLCDEPCATEMRNYQCLLCGAEDAELTDCRKYVAPTPAVQTITAWTWNDKGEEEYEEPYIIDGAIGLPTSVDWETLEALVLPDSITATVNGENIPLSLTWTCENFVPNGSGVFTLTAALPEGYVFENGGTTQSLTLDMGGGEGYDTAHSCTNSSFATALTTLGGDLTSGSYYLDADTVAATGTITIPADAEVTLCMNGKTLSMGSYTITNKGTLTICDCQSTHGTIQFTSGRLIVDANSTASFENVTLDGGGNTWGTSSGSPILIRGTATLGNGAKIQNFNKTTQSGGQEGNKGVITIFASSSYTGSLTMNEGAEISNNSCDSGIVALYRNQYVNTIPTFKMTGGSFTGNTVALGTSNYDMGVINNWSGKVEISNGSITHTAADTSRFAVHTQGDEGKSYAATTTISGGTFTVTNGGALAVGGQKDGWHDTSLTVTGGKFTGTNALTVRYGNANISGGNFEGSQYGIYAAMGSNYYSGNLFLSGSPTISGNKADIYYNTFTISAQSKDKQTHYSGDPLRVQVADTLLTTGGTVIYNVNSDKKNLFSVTNPNWYLKLYNSNLVLTDQAPVATHTHTDDTVYIPLTPGGELTTGSYYLDADTVYATETIYISDEAVVNLCLNGKTLNLGGYYNITNSGTLNICDCQGGGKITNGDDVIITNDYILNISGGEIIGDCAISNFSSEKSVATISGTAKISATDNYAVTNNGTLYLSGTPEITANKGAIQMNAGSIYANSKADGTGTAYEGDSLAMYVFQASSKVGNVIVYYAEEGKFSVINDGYALKQSGTNLVLKKVHTHTDGITFDQDLTKLNYNGLSHGNYVLTNRVVHTGSMPSLTGNQTVNLCLNGFELYLSNTLFVETGCAVNFYDCSANKTGVFTSNSPKGIGNVDGTVTFNGITYNCANGDAVENLGTGNLVINNSNITGKYSAVFNSGTLTITGNSSLSGGDYDIYLTGGKTNSAAGYTGDTLDLYVSTNDYLDKVVFSGVTNASKFNLTNNTTTHYLSLEGTNLYLRKYHTHDGITFDQKLSGTLSPASSDYQISGNYYLKDDYTVNGEGMGFHYYVPSGETLNLCLNGHTMDLKDGYIEVRSGGTLNICDCSEGKTGKITGTNTRYSTIVNKGAVNISSGTVKASGTYGIKNTGTITMTGGSVVSTKDDAISNETGATLTISAGTVTGSSKAVDNRGTVTISGTAELIGQEGAGLINYGTAHISGGTIKSTSEYVSAGISNNGTLYLSGDPTITSANNFAKINIEAPITASSQNGTPYSGDKLTLAISSYFADATEGTVIVKNVTDDNAGKFELQSPTFILKRGTGTNANHLVLANAHNHAWTGWDFDAAHHWKTCTADCPITDNSQKEGYAAHTFTYTASGSVITESCTCGHSATATITATSGTYNGQSFDAEVNYTGNTWVGTKPSITYTTNGGSEDRKNAGTYTASIKMDNQEATVTYTVSPLEATLSWSAPTSLVYDGTRKVPTVTVSNKVGSDTVTVTASLTEGKDNISVGSFTFTATALNNSNYSLSTDVTSPQYEITKASLSAPTGLQWDTETPGKVSWNAVTNATGYVVKLYMGNTMVGDAVTVTSGTDYTFPIGTGSTYIKESGAYSFSVQAIGDTNYTDSNPATSDAKSFYTVTWKNGETVLETDVVMAGKTASYDGETPTKAADETYVYAFTGWSPTVGTVNDDTTYTAQFSTAYQKPTDANSCFTIDYRNEKVKAASGYQIQNGEQWVNEKEIEPGETITVRKTASGSTNPSEGTTATLPGRPNTPAAPELHSKTNTTVILKAVAGQEYARRGTTGSWSGGSDTAVFGGLSANLTYNFVTRIAATETSFASAESTALEVKTKSAPGAAPAAPSYTQTDTTITVTPVEGLEYSIDGGTTWTETPTFTGLTPGTAYEILTRVAETEDAMPSQTQKTTVYTAAVAPAAGDVTIDYPNETITIPAGCEYSSDNGQTWTKATEFDMEPGTTYLVRVAVNGNIPASAPLKVITVSRPAAPAEATPAPSRDDVTDTAITVGAVPGQEYVILPADQQPDKDAWSNAITPATGETTVTFGNLEENTEYVIYTRVPATEEKPSSQPTSSEPVKTKTAPGAAPAAPSYTQTDTTITVTPVEGLEYSIDDGTTWTETPTFTGLTPGTAYKILTRVAETEDAMSSQPQKTTVYTAPTTPSILIGTDGTGDVKVDYVNETITIPAGYEYRINDGKWVKVNQNTSVTLNPGDIYEIRVAANGQVPPSASVEIETKERPAAPSTSIPGVSRDDVTDTTITVGAVPGQEYIAVPKDTTPTKADWEKAIQPASGETTVIFTGLTPGVEYEIYTRVPAEKDKPASDSIASEPVTTKTAPVNTPATAKPSVEITDTSITVTNSQSGYEYLVVPAGTADPDWSDAKEGNGGTIKLNTDPLNPGTEYEVLTRVAETETAMPSKPLTESVTTRPVPPTVSTDSTSSVKVDYENEKITVPGGYSYSDDGGKTWTKVTQDREIDLKPGTEYQFKVTATSTVPESAVVTFTTGVRPTAPAVNENTENATGIVKIEESYQNQGNAAITGVDDSYEYSMDGGISWTSVPTGETSISNPNNATILLRKEATNDMPAGESTTVTFPASDVTITASDTDNETPGSFTYGESTTLTVSPIVENTGLTYQYQWYHNDTPIEGATSADYQIPTTTSAGKHNYHCVVTVTGGKNQTITTAPVEIAIAQKALVEENFTVDLKDEIYTGSPITKEITSGLTAGSDYEVSYSANTNVGTVTVTITGKGNYSGTIKMTFEITKADPAITWPGESVDLVGTAGGKLSDITLPTSDQGTFSWQKPDTAIGYPSTTVILVFTPKDTANYNVLTKEITVTGVDETAPTGTMVIEEGIVWDKFFDKLIFELFYKEPQTVTVTSADSGSGVAKTEYLVSDRELTEDQTKTITHGWTVFDGSSFVVDMAAGKEEKKVVYVKITDVAGNAAIINSNGLVMDNVVPQIAGLAKGMTYCLEVNFTVTETYLGSVKLDGVVITPDNNGVYTVGPKAGAQTVTAYDKAGNPSVTYTITVNPRHTFTVWSGWVDGENSSICSVHNCTAKLSAFAKDTGFATDLEVEAVQRNVDMELNAVSSTLTETEDASVRTLLDLEKYHDLYNLEITVNELQPSGKISVSETNNVLEIPVTFSFDLTEDVALYRIHEGQLSQLNKLGSRAGGSGQDGTYYPDEEKGVVYIYADKFSDYGIAYHRHELVHRRTRYPSSSSTGYREHWHCRDCNSFFLDEEASRETTWRRLELHYSENPRTGDYILIAVTVLVLSACGLIAATLYYKRKKKHQK